VLRARAACKRLITQSDYDKKARDLEKRQVEIAMRIEQHLQGETEGRPHQ
jgi:hypothetical protein